METGVKSSIAVPKQYGAALLAQTVFVIRTPSVGIQFILKYIRNFKKFVKNKVWALA